MDIKDSVFIAEGAKVLKDVTIKENSSVWFNAVIRGDSNSIYIGANSNVQDNAVIHTSSDHKVEIGNNVTIGHNAIIHGATIKDNVLFGMGAIILDGAIINENCIIGAGTLIPQNKIIPANSLVYGNPFKIVRELTDLEKEKIISNALKYVNKAKEYKNK